MTTATASSPWTVTAGSGDGGGGFEIAAAGPHPAVLIGLFDIGTHHESYMGESSDKRKLFMVWELVDSPMSGVKCNMCIGQEFTMSMHEKANLRKLIEDWSGRKLADGEQFDFSTIIGKKCIVNVKHKTNKAGDKTFAEVGSVNQPMKNQEIEDSVQTPMMWSVDEGTPPPDAIWLPRIYGSTIADKVRDSKEWMRQNSGGGGTGAEPGFDTPTDDPEDAPF